MLCGPQTTAKSLLRFPILQFSTAAPFRPLFPSLLGPAIHHLPRILVPSPRIDPSDALLDTTQFQAPAKEATMKQPMALPPHHHPHPSSSLTPCQLSSIPCPNKGAFISCSWLSPASHSRMLLTSTPVFLNPFSADIRTFQPLFTSRARQQTRALVGSTQTSTSTSQETGDTQKPSEFKKWPNGGGLVHNQATVHESATVEAGSVVWDGATVAEGAVIGSCSVVGPNVSVGSGTRLHYNVSLQNCRLGNRCILHQGVSVGAEGFGFYIDDKGNMVKKPQPMGVVIGDEVEIGANSCVDRGSWRDTSIGDQTKIDNLVQVGHNAVVGRCCIICGQTGLGGSSTLGDYVVLAGQVGVADHVSIVSQVRVGAKSGVSANITKPGDYAGYPVVPASEWRRQVVLQRRTGRPGQGSE